MRTELDSHANMVVLGRNCFVFDSVQDRYCEVEPFDKSIGTLKRVPIVDAAIVYDCPYTMKSHLFIIRNALYIPTLYHNLIPPFIMREAGLQVNETPKIHVPDATSSDHAIIFPDDDLKIPLLLKGTFSYFETRKPDLNEINNSDPIYITPDSDNWDPYSEHFSQNEASMLDDDGNIRNKRFRNDHVLDLNVTTPTDTYNTAVDRSSISSFRATTHHNNMNNDEESDLASNLEAQLEISKMKMAIGSTVGMSDFDGLFIPDPDGTGEICSTTAQLPKGITSTHLSKIWKIKEDLAQRALDQTTHLYRQGMDNELSKRLSTNDRMLQYKRINSQFFTDTLFVTKEGKSTRGNTCAQLFVSDKGYVAIYPMASKSEFPAALEMFCKDIGVPRILVVDPSGEQTSKQVRTYCHKVGITLRVLEESTQWANRAELYIGLFKKSIKQDLSNTNSPLKFWDYCAERRTHIHNVLPRDLFQLNGYNPTTATFGTQDDISNISRFNWYEWCYFREESKVQFPFQNRQLGRVLGPLKNEGNAMTQAVLNIKGNIVPRQTCTPLTIAEINSKSEETKRDAFDEIILQKYGNSMRVPIQSSKQSLQPLPDAIKTIDSHFGIGDDGEDAEEPLEPIEEDPVDTDGKTVFEKPVTDMLIHAEVLLPQGEGFTNAKVKCHACDLNGDMVGQYDPNPLLNSVIYDVEFPDREIKQYSANIIAQNMYEQVDAEGYSRKTFD